MTPENEEQLKYRFINDLNPDTFYRLKKMVDVIFTKAIEEAHFSKRYAKLCRFCHDEWHKAGKYIFDVEEKVKDKNNVEKVVKKQKSFRAVLLMRAQQEFMKFKILDSKDKSVFEQGSYEWKLLECEEKIAALPPNDASEVNHFFVKGNFSLSSSVCAC